MITLMMILQFATSLIIYFNRNPLKMACLTLTLAAFLFLKLCLTIGSPWMPMILFMMFTGGILMAFMILASLAPNNPMESKKKTSKIIMAALVSGATMGPASFFYMGQGSVTLMKEAVLSYSSMSALTLVILMYFFGFVTIISSTKTSMRSFLQC